MPTQNPTATPATKTPAPSRWRWAAVLILASTVVLASSRSQIAAPPGVPGVDKIAHFGVFGLLATLVVRAPCRRRAWPLCAVALVSFFGMSDEFHQSFTPGRSVEFADWAADTLGAALAVTLYCNWSLYRRVLEWSLPVPGLFRRRTTLAPDAASASVSTATKS